MTDLNPTRWAILLLFLAHVCAYSALVSQMAVGEEVHRNVTLMIYLEDSKGAVTQEVFENTVEFLQSSSATPVRAVFLREKMKQSERLSAIEAALKPEDRISGLVLGTHGSTHLATTFLSGLGALTPAGPTGFLRKLFSRFSNRWSPDLFIYLTSCSTFRGPEPGVRARVRSLARYLTRFGIQNLAIWGARQSIRSDGRGALLYPYEERGSVSDKSHIVNFANSVLLGVLVGQILNDYGFDARAILMSGALPTVVLSYFGGTIVSFINSVSGTAGRLALASGGNVNVIEMDGNDSRLINMSCESLLASH